MSLAWPHGKLAAGAENSFSRKRIVGIEPPSRMKIGFTTEEASGDFGPVLEVASSEEGSDFVRSTKVVSSDGGKVT